MMFRGIFRLIDRLEECLSALTKINVILVKLLEIAQQPCQPQRDVSAAPSPVPADPDGYDSSDGVASYEEEELMTVKEAMAELRVSRWKINDMREKGELRAVVRAGRVRLIKSEVEDARRWYSQMKGKV